MNEVKIFDYSITQEDGLWIIRVPELELVTQAEHLRDTDRMATSIISLHLNVAADSIVVRRSNIIGLPSGAVKAVANAVKARGRWNEAQVAANEETLTAVHRLRECGVSLRDTGYLLGLSHQRIAQLLEGERTPAKTGRSR